MLQQVLEAFWAESIDFSLILQGFGWEGWTDGLGTAAGLGPAKPRVLRKSTKAKPRGKGKGEAKDKGKTSKNPHSRRRAKRGGG